MPWYVYLVCCVDGTLYTGCATDITRRIRKHNAGRGAKYTRGRRPVRLVAASPAMLRSEALRLEYKIKQLPWEQKEAAVRRGKEY